MTKINLTIKPASEEAVKLFHCGNATFPERFSYATKREQATIARSLKGFDAQFFRRRFDRADLDALKQDILLGHISDRGKSTRRELTKITMNGVHAARARTLSVALMKLWQKQKKAVMYYLRTVLTRTGMLSYTAIIMPGVGESSNIVRGALVIGADAPKSVAFGILLEELLHGVLNIPARKKFGMTSVSDWLYNEAYTGAHLYRLLTTLKYSPKIRDSLVFGWQGGKRTKLVNNILLSLNK